MRARTRPSLAHEIASSTAVVPDAERYEAGDLLGRGGVGEVRSAVDRRVGREVAVKVLAHPERSTPDTIARFLREARVQGLLDHPAIVPVHDLGVDDDGRPYFVMKRLSGITLADVLVAQAAGDGGMIARFSRRTLLARFADVCLAVEFAHRRGVVHRDIKPSNIMLGDFGEVWILDWGCAKITEPTAPATRATSPALPPLPAATIDVADLPANQTSDGEIMGTPGFLAPEQLAAGRPYDHRVDVYALGSVLFEILALRPLHAPGRDGMRTTLLGVEARPGVRAPDADVAPELDAVCERAVAVDPGARFQRARDVADAVQQYLDGDRDLERRRQLALVHAGRAGAARAAGRRAEAMREAGRALALDPSNVDAAALVTQLMLVPPDEAPPEVAIAIDAAEAELGRAHGRAALGAFVTYFGILGMLLAQGVTDWLMFGIVAAMIVILGGSAVIGALMRRLPSPALVTLALTGNALLVTLLSRFAGPFVLLPGALVAAVMALMSHPVLLSRPARVLVIMIAGFLAPFGLELAGVWEPLWTLDQGALIARSGFVDLSGPWTAALLVTLTVMLTTWTGLATRKLGTMRREAQRRVELQAWHLRQLVDDRRG